MVAGGHVWLLGGVHGCQGACMVARGCAWLWGGAWLQGDGVGGCVVVGGCIAYDEIRSMSELYASYWNAFLSILLPPANEIAER